MKIWNPLVFGFVLFSHLFVVSGCSDDEKLSLEETVSASKPLNVNIHSGLYTRQGGG